MTSGAASKQQQVRDFSGAAATFAVADQRTVAPIAIWLSMALANEGTHAETARTIGPVVTMYRGLEKRNHGDEWLPLEYTEALYAQSLTDDRYRPELLRESSGLIDHLIPAIARLHDTRVPRPRIEKTGLSSDGQAAAR